LAIRCDPDCRPAGGRFACLVVAAAAACTAAGADGPDVPAEDAAAAEEASDGADGEEEAPSGDADGSSGDAEDGEALRLPWADLHVHCRTVASRCADTASCCPTATWDSVAAATGPGRGALLSLEHFAVKVAVGDEPADYEYELQNERYAEAAAADPALVFLASLECWYDTPFDDPGWADACREDADRWLAAGAAGFKDHVGKVGWLGPWNRLNGFCAVPPETDPAQRDAVCLAQEGVRYPACEPRWRTILAWLVEERGVPVVTHAAERPGAERTPPVEDERCFDARAGAVRPCHEVIADCLLDLAAWAEAELGPEARRRIVVPHFAYLWHPGDSPRLDELLGRGLSVDTAMRVDALGGDGCAMRCFLARYPEQVLFGTDHMLVPDECATRPRYEAYLWALSGAFGEVREFPGCWSWAPVAGLELGSVTVAGCACDVPPALLADVLRGNFERLLE
jgi:hypothetical protein